MNIVDMLFKRMVDGIKVDFDKTDKKISLIIGFTTKDEFDGLCVTLDEITLDILNEGYYISGDSICSDYICGKQKYFRQVTLRLKEAVNA